jgi:hypothetical protein
MRTPILLAALLVLSSASGANDSQDQRTDLEFLRDQVVAKSLAFSAADRVSAAKAIDHLIAGGRPLSNEAFLLTTLRIAAMAGNAHEGVHGGGWMPSTRLPFRTIWFSDGIVIARASPQYAELVGARVESIEGQDPKSLQRRLRPFFGGTDDYVRWNGLWLVELGGMMHAIGIARDADRLRMRLRRTDGRVVDVTVPFVPRAQTAVGASPPRLWSAAPYASEQKYGWTSAIDGRPQPLYLRDDEDPFRIVHLVTLDTLYVQFRANSTADAGGREIQPFVQRVRDEMAAVHPTYLVLDLRFDIGGDIDQTRELATQMVRAVPGRIFVLTGPYTFSAGIVFAAAVKHDGRDRVTIVGEPVGDRLRFWSEGKHACMPKSGYCFQVSNGLWDLVHGCSRDAACYGDRLDARVDSLDPDIAGPLTSRDWLSGRDPAMEAVTSAIFSRSGPPQANRR